MNILGLCSYPVESAATRYRLIQFIEPLAKEGISLTVSPFLDSQAFDLLYSNQSLFGRLFGFGKPFLNRLAETLNARKYDLLLVQREAMIFGPAFFEWIFQKAGRIPMILDLDDATYISYISPTYGKVGSFFKFFGKTDRLIKRADAVICGNRFIAEYVERKGTRTIIVPTVVDTDKFRPAEKTNETPVIGWIGTHSTFPFLKSIFPVLQKLASEYEFKLKIVGSGKDELRIDGVDVENLPWRLDREVTDFQSLDIGLYPMELGAKIPDEWIAGKSGFKAIQYMATGIPYVMSPIGVCAEIGLPGETHFLAASLSDWEKNLAVLLNSLTIREKMGANGREHALENYTIDIQNKKIVHLLQAVAGGTEQLLHE